MTDDQLYARSGLSRKCHEPCDDMTYNTPMQCDCFTAGQDHNFASIVHHINKILDGKDSGQGANFEPWGSLRRRLLDLVKGQK